MSTFGVAERTFSNDPDNQTGYDVGRDLYDKYATATGCVGVEIPMSNSNLRLSDVVMANLEAAPSGSYSVDISDDIRGTSSIEAIRHGYLYPTVNVDSSSKIDYFGNRNNTNASSLFLINSQCAYDVVNRYKALLSHVENGDLNITPDEVVDNDHDIMFGLDQYNFKGGINDFITGSLGEYKFGETGGYDGYYYSLYSESPYYFFSFNVRDQVHSSMNYIYDYQSLKNSAGDDDFYKLLIKDNQGYFYNLSENAGDGYGELRDFMNMHDFFYYIMPLLKTGNDLTNLYADIFGMEISDHSTLHLSSDGKIHYSGLNYNNISEMKDVIGKMTKEELYDFWHDYNVRTVYNAYTPWLNLMYACDYAKPEKIHILGDTFIVQNPLDPTSYFSLDSSGKINGGRYMVFSRSEQMANGIQWSDLTTVEQKIITLQEDVYSQAIRIMDYYNLSNETLISYMAMLELFEFNKAFSQESLFFGNYTLYPQSYELKAFTYDAYLRLILNGATDGSNYQDELQVTGGQSIYERIIEKTSLFFGIVLLINDFVAVYLIPMLKLFFLVTIFIVSILIIVAATTKLDMPGGGILQAIWKSLAAPLVVFACISIGMAAVVVLFMSSGGGTVTKRTLYISLGDPTMTCIAMLLVNIIALILYFKLCKKVFKDFKTYVTSVFDTIASNVMGAVGKMAGVVAAGNRSRRFNKMYDGISRLANTPNQRGVDNTPSSGNTKLSGISDKVKSLASGAGGGSGDGSGGGGNSGGLDTNKYNSRSQSKLEAAEKKGNKLLDKHARKEDIANNIANDKAEKMRLKYGDGSEQYKKALLKGESKREKINNAYDKRARIKNAQIDRLKQRAAYKSDNKARNDEFNSSKRANIEKFGRVYGTAKNVGVTFNHVKSNASAKLNQVGVEAGNIGARFMNWGDRTAETGTKISGAVRNGVSTGVGIAKKGAHVASSFANNPQYGMYVAGNVAKLVGKGVVNKGRSGLGSAAKSVGHQRESMRINRDVTYRAQRIKK